MTRMAKVFTNGGSQAVRLPAEFRFDDVQQVYIRRDAVTGDVVLSARPPRSAWQQFFAVRDAAPPVEDPLAGRPHNAPLTPPKLFDGE